MSLRSSGVNAFFVLVFSVFLASPSDAEDALLPAAEIGEDGLHVQSWYHESFLDLNEDLGEAEASGKRLMIMWEQRGCPYCKRMHEINLRIPRIVETLKKDFLVLQLNLWGDREVTDFDGEVLKEKELANKWRVMFTPTVQFFPASVADVGGKPGVDAEVVRIPGYFKPFHFFFLLQYAKTDGYAQEANFQRWLGGIAEKLEEQGVHYDIYADNLPKDLPKEF